MPQWNLDFKYAPGIIRWSFEGERTLDLLLLPSSSGHGNIVPVYQLGVEYTEQDLQHLEPSLARRVARLTNGSYWVPILSARSPEELENKMRNRYPLTTLPSEYRKFWEQLNERLT